MTVGERITSLRKARGLSQVQLAKLLDVTRQAVSKWENDLTAPDTIKLIQLADVLDTDVEYLATGNHSRIKAPPEVITVTKPVEKIVERVVEKPVVVERIVEVEKIVESVVEIPKIKRVQRIKYLRNPVEFAAVAAGCFILGILVGMLI